MVWAAMASGALLLIWHEVGLFENCESMENSGFKEPWGLSVFLIGPVVPMIVVWGISGKGEEVRPERAARLAAGVASVVMFLVIGAVGFAWHTRAFTNVQSLVKTEGSEVMVEAILKDVLSTSASRYLFVDYVHTVISFIIFSMHEMQGTGGMALIGFVASLVGPTGAFALLAAHHEFRILKEERLI